MKKMIFAAALFVGFSAQAAQVPAFKCSVPGKVTSTVAVEIAVSDSEAVDFITVNLNDKGMINLFSQLEKGGFKTQVDAGAITSLVLGEQFSQGDDGVVRDAGVLALGLENAKWTGLMAVKGNVYPLECTKL